MRAGRLDRLITIQRKSVVSSDSGEPQESWSTLVLRRPATVAAIRGDETFSNPQVLAKELTQFWIWRSADVADVSPQDRIIYPALAADSPVGDAESRRIYDIVAVHEAGREGLKLIAERRPDILS